MKRRLCLAFLCFLFILGIPAHGIAATAAQGQQVVYTTLPWLSKMARFIAGATIKVQPIVQWKEDGALTRAIRNIPDSATIIALDPDDAKTYGFSTGRKTLHLLYDNLPVPPERRSSLSYDPSALPFLSQRMLIVLSRIEPGNYAFYQRRLAEFQSRMESTIEVGRSQIRATHLLDLTGSAGPWVRAAAGGMVRPPEDLLSAWRTGKRIPELVQALNEAKRRNWWIALDAWTPAPIRAQVMGAYRNIYITPPKAEQDFFAYLQDIYLEIWNAIVRN